MTDIAPLPDLNGHGSYNFVSTTPAQCVYVDVEGQLGADPDDDDEGGCVTAPATDFNVMGAFALSTRS